MDVRHQVSIGSIGGDLALERGRIVSTIVGMGHFPADLTQAGVLGQGIDSQRRHIGRSDYLVIIVGQDEIEPGDELNGIGRLFELALADEVPVLRLVMGGADRLVPNPDSEDVQRFYEMLLDDIPGLFKEFDGQVPTAAWALSTMMDIYKRSGWVSAKEVPGDEVVTEITRLSQTNAELLEKVALEDTEIERRKETRDKSVMETLRANRILIPLWTRAGSQWERPVEITLYDFFLHVAPELAVEQSAAGIAAFIPAGVCGLDAGDYRTAWPVPPNSLNLWLADLMALDLVEPSKIKHNSKDTNQYWSLTQEGRDLVSRIRRSALEGGGHRHVGFTQEFQIVSNAAMLRRPAEQAED